MTKKSLIQQAKNLKSEMSKRRLAQASITDLCTLLTCRAREDYTAVFSTILYNRHSGEYCEYLQIIG